MSRRIIHHENHSLHLVRLSSASPNVEWVPNADIYETESSFVVRMEIAGVNEDDLKVSFEERTLTVRGKRPDPCRKGLCHFRQMEIDYGVFERKFVVPRSVNTRKIKAHCKNGFLTLELPKTSRSEPTPLRIKIEND